MPLGRWWAIFLLGLSRRGDLGGDHLRVLGRDLFLLLRLPSFNLLVQAHAVASHLVLKVSDVVREKGSSF